MLLGIFEPFRWLKIERSLIYAVTAAAQRINILDNFWRQLRLSSQKFWSHCSHLFQEIANNLTETDGMTAQKFVDALGKIDVGGKKYACGLTR